MNFETRKNENTTGKPYKSAPQNNDYSLKPPKTPSSQNLDLYQPKSNNDSKIFKSQYINDSGKWTQKAVNDNFVDFDDYISDMQNETEKYLSFNNKPFKINYNQDNKFPSQTKDKTDDYTLKSNGYTLKANEGIVKSDDYNIDEDIEPELVAFNPITKYIEYKDERRKNFQRDVWRLGAENYLSKLDKAISESTDGTIDTDLEKVRFKTGDLYYSIHKADIHVKGYKQDNGKWIIYAELDDIYNFDQIQTLMGDKGEFSFDIGLGTIANDIALGSQKLGAINPYNVKVQFYTTR